MDFTEQDTEQFYDKEDALYRSFWDSDGTLHWGLFKDLSAAGTKEDFHAATKALNNFMLERAKITAESTVLDLGCGNGTVAAWLAQQTGCSVIGIDLSGVRINNAKKNAETLGLTDKLTFIHTSACDLSKIPDHSLTHVWCQATIYHVHNREQALREVSRVLKEGGLFVLDDLVTPPAHNEITPDGQQYVYKRLLFKPTWSLDGYKNALSTAGFHVLEAVDWKLHLIKSYQILGEIVADKFSHMSHAYRKMVECINQDQISWCFFVSEKIPTNRVSWVYSSESKDTLHKRYDWWAKHYDIDVAKQQYNCPFESSEVFPKIETNKAAKILDAGAGTGLAGIGLKKHGYTNVTAFDLSDEMLTIAKSKDIYTHLKQGDLCDITTYPRQTPSGTEPETFDDIVCIGVYTCNHAPASSLLVLDKVLKIGGYVVVAFREDYLNTNEELKKSLETLQWVRQEELGFKSPFDNGFLVVCVFKKESEVV